MFLIKNCYGIYLSLGFLKGRSSYRRSLQPLFLWVIFALLNPDPDPQHWLEVCIATTWLPIFIKSS
jgi:hypothetical protein